MKKENLKLFAFIAVMLLASSGYADGLSQGGAGDLPWEGAMEKLTSSIKGPVAFGISLVAIIGAGIGLIFGGEISGFLKASLILALVIGLIVSASNVLSGLFTSGALLVAQTGTLVSSLVA
jgi:type IV secretory pathway VirB2 component (pilin)